MNRVKRQHYVPHFYLSNWCTDNQLWVFDTLTEKVYQSNARNVAASRGTYDTKSTSDPHNEETFQLYERKFSEFEGRVAGTINRVIEKARRLSTPIALPYEYSVLDEVEITDVVDFTVVQLLRDMKHRADSREMMNEFLTEVWNRTAPIMFGETRPVMPSIDEDYLKEHQMKFLSTRLSRMAQLLHGKIIVVGINPITSPLYSSDSPVLRLGYVVHPLVPWDGLTSPSSQIVIPLAPDVCLIFFDSKFPQYQLEQGAYNRRIRNLQAEEAFTFNKHMVLQCDRCVFSSRQDFSEAQFVLAQKKISNEKWTSMSKDSPSPLEGVLGLFIQLAHYRKGQYTEEEWLAFIQMEGVIPSFSA
ncbi:MAG: DUF4238 domain-containing protein [Cyanobacteria bacterium]|nr:DUF4238 domain-containing protein [Cyanobacteriota bacterium]